MTKSIINVHNGQKTFNGHKVLDGMTLSIEKGTILGLAGPSGSGKSTLLRCVQGFDHLDSGTMTCSGTTGFMFQDFQLFPHMTVWDNLVYAPMLQKKSPVSSKKEDALQGIPPRAETFLHSLGITEQRQKYPHQLSGGQKQRVALARTLMMRPEILLCDEPTSGLDVATIGDVVSLLQSVRSFVTTMVIASHDLDFLTAIADKVMMLKQGKIIFYEDIKTLENSIDHLKKYYYSDK